MVKGCIIMAYIVDLAIRTVTVIGASVSASKDAESIDLPNIEVCFDKYTDEEVFIEATKAIMIKEQNRYRAMTTHKDPDKKKPHKVSTWADFIGLLIHPMPADRASKVKTVEKAKDTIKKALDELIRQGLTREEALERLGF